MNEKVTLNNADIQLWHGDCLELMKDITDKSVDCIICDKIFISHLFVVNLQKQRYI